MQMGKLTFQSKLVANFRLPPAQNTKFMTKLWVNRIYADAHRSCFLQMKTHSSTTMCVHKLKAFGCTRSLVNILRKYSIAIHMKSCQSLVLIMHKENSEKQFHRIPASPADVGSINCIWKHKMAVLSGETKSPPSKWYSARPLKTPWFNIRLPFIWKGHIMGGSHSLNTLACFHIRSSGPKIEAKTAIE